jgi:hypothetical protein
MAYLLASIPYLRCLVRREYVRDLKDGHGEYLEATAVAVLSVRGDSLHFQVVLHEPFAGCSFLVPIEALVTKPCEPVATKMAQPWDAFAPNIGVCEIEALRRTPVRILHEPASGVYRFTIASTGTDLADDPAQRKLLHVVTRDDGIVGAYPNNRCVFIDRALFGDLTETPDFETLTHEFRAEALGGIERATPPAAPTSVLNPSPNGHYASASERPDWHQDARV